ncbi:hypothetical protein K1L80_003058 [Vibrio fluvialis]|nr:hypothetical protein [Vibrio fluvialis]
MNRIYVNKTFGEVSTGLYKHEASRNKVDEQMALNIDMKSMEIKNASKALNSLLLYLNVKLEAQVCNLNGDEVIKIIDDNKNVVKTLDYKQLKSLLDGGYAFSEKI